MGWEWLQRTIMIWKGFHCEHLHGNVLCSHFCTLDIFNIGNAQHLIIISAFSNIHIYLAPITEKSHPLWIPINSLEQFLVSDKFQQMLYSVVDIEQSGFRSCMLSLCLCALAPGRGQKCAPVLVSIVADFSPSLQTHIGIGDYYFNYI